MCYTALRTTVLSTFSSITIKFTRFFFHVENCHRVITMVHLKNPSPHLYVSTFLIASYSYMYILIYICIY